MEIQYINLARRPDRNASFLELNSHLTQLRRIDAIEGSTLNPVELVKEGFMTGPLPSFSPGSLGNSLTHKRIWEAGVRIGSAITVAEDDAVFNLHFETKAAQVIADLPADWDFILWGWNFDSILDVEMIRGLTRSAMVFDVAKLGAGIHKFQASQYSVAPLRLLASFGMVAYSASVKGMSLMLEKCFPLQHENITLPSLRRKMWNCGIDATLNKIYPTMQAYVSVPPLVWTENDHASSDVNTSVPGKFQAR